ncbi:MAG: R2-like ligand-binding oxidase [Ardenticatenaceae bacterium]|nr:R2-like ligand-binding oxidase [Ardenticatenaceae bacterium]
MIHQSFVTTSRGLRRDAPPMRLFEKAKRLGVWNPSDIDLSQDMADWQGLTAEEQDILLNLTALFQAGEEAVTLDLLPLIMTVAAEGRLEEELFLTTFLFEEAKHTDFFHRFLTEVAQLASFDLSHYHLENYRALFYEALPQALQGLRHDPSPAAQVRASVTYNMIVEGMLAETGYEAYFKVLEENGILPGTRQGIYLLKQDESRHIAYGIYLLSRLVAVDAGLWQVVEETMNELLMPAIAVIGDVFGRYEVAPFGLVEADFVDFAMGQFEKRIERLERARGASLAEIERVAREAEEG